MLQIMVEYIVQDGAYIVDDIITLINILQAFTNSDSIISVYMVPESIIINSNTESNRFNQNSVAYNSQIINKPYSLNDYIPKNNKLLIFPYCCLNVSNNNGISNTFQYELFNEIEENPNQCVFNIKGVPTIGGSIKCIPLNYKNSNEENNEEEGIMAGKFPTLSWSADEFTNWLTQNAVNIGIGVASNLLTIVAGLGMMATGGGAVAGAGSVVSGGMGIASQLGQVYEHSLTPNSARGNTNGGDITSSSNTNTFYFYQMSIKREYAKIIDDFFSMYGYKVNSVKIPNITGRPNWNYVKTIDINIIGDIPQFDLSQIKLMFDSGVTFWHNPLTFLDYSQNNMN